MTAVPLAPAQPGYRTYGARRHPAIVVLGGISSGRDVAADGSGRPGWWPEIVGDGLAIDTRRRFVIGADYLGGSGTAASAPRVTTGDQARAIAALLDRLGIHRVEAIVGASYGGMVALAFAALHPERIGRAVVISAAHRSHPMATALRSLQRQVVRLGLTTGRERAALEIARGIAMTTYRTAAEFAGRFDAAPIAGPDGEADARFAVEDYLAHCGRTYAGRTSPEGFLRLSESIDLHQVEPAAIRAPTTLVAVESDTLVPSWLMRELRDRLAGPVELHTIDSIYGHDAFLKETGALDAILRHALSTSETHAP